MTTLGPFYMNRQQTKLPESNSVLAVCGQESYRGVADRFNISKSTVSTHLHHFCALVNTRLSHHISWPTGGFKQPDFQKQSVLLMDVTFPHTATIL